MLNTAIQLAPSARADKIEDIVLRHSGRGMTLLRDYLEPDYCRRAAQSILALPRGVVFLATGFYVSGHAETDGPPGTFCLALALRRLGYLPIILTDGICRGLFEPEKLEVKYVGADADAPFYESLLALYQPVCLISVERCGRNLDNDYANMRGASIAGQTARIDTLFELAAREGIYTIGIGDGGNEIGMGNLREVIHEKLSLNPCAVTVDTLIIATTSNWGAYALAAWLGILRRRRTLPAFGRILRYLEKIVSVGCVDGVTGQSTATVDGFPVTVEQEIIDALHLTAASAPKYFR